MISLPRKIKINEKLGKTYKLCKQKEIAGLFKTGKKIYKFPYTAHFSLQNEPVSSPFQLVIAVPKRNFKKAQDRNRIKRCIKEAFRKNKLNLEAFLIHEHLQLSLFLMFSPKEELTFDEISKKTEQFISFLIENSKNEKIPE